jgi:HK97 family phage prohead protease
MLSDAPVQIGVPSIDRSRRITQLVRERHRWSGARLSLGTADAGCEQSQSGPYVGPLLCRGSPMRYKHQNSPDFRPLKCASPSRFKLAAAAGRIEGYASIFGNVDSYGERVVKGAFAGSIREYQAEGRMPALLWQHRSDEPVGRWTSMKEDDVGLWMVGEFNLDTSRGADAYQHAQAGDVDGLSIGYATVKAVPNGQVLDLIELRLMEASIVTFPANPKARITGVKAESATDVEKILREGGLPREYAAKFAKAGWAALAGQSESDPIEERKLDELLQAVKSARLQLKET